MPHHNPHATVEPRPVLAKSPDKKPAAARSAAAKPDAAKPTTAKAAAATTVDGKASVVTSIPGKTGSKPRDAVHDGVPGAKPGTDAGRATGAPTARGHDVADVRAVGLEFPYPGYLDNLVRQVRVRFSPTQARGGLHADLAFVVARDGSVSGLRVVRGSGNYAFDLEAQGAVEAAGAAHAFGPLPDGFHAHALPVTFSFDPRPTP